MAKICMLVLNSVTRDPRVMKEAASLVRAGHQVWAVGVAEDEARSVCSRAPEGPEILRCPTWQGQGRVLASPWLLAMCVAGGLCAAAALALLWLSGSVLGLLKVMSTLVLVLALGLAAWKLGPALRRGTRLVVGPLKLRRFKRFARRELARLDPDVVHCHDLLTLPVGVAHARKHPRVRCVYDSHEIFEDQSRLEEWQSRVFRRMQVRLSPHVDGFITVNDSIAALLRERYPALPEPTVIMNAVEYDGEPLPYDGCLHRAAGLDPQTRILLYHGGLVDYRGLTTLVGSGHHLPPGWAIVLMGEGALEPVLRDLVAEESLKNVRFARPVPRQDLPHWTAGAAVGVILYENVCLNHFYCSPNKIWEYPAAGVPILAGPLEVVDRIVRENGIGWTLPDPVTAHTVAAAVASLSDAEIEEKRRNCRQFIRRDNWAVYEKRLLGLYERLTDQQG